MDIAAIGTPSPCSSVHSSRMPGNHSYLVRVRARVGARVRVKMRVRVKGER